MRKFDEFDAMAEACIASHELIVRLGSPEMEAASRLLLFALGQEIGRRDRVKLTDVMAAKSDYHSQEVRRADWARSSR